MISGVPQVTVLGPLCFFIYINDLGNNISHESSLKLFADDSLLFRIIENKNDTETLQKDIDSLTSWTNTWQMNFHPSKYFVMSITNKRNPIKHDYKILGQTLEHVDNIPYLGVHLDKSLKWKHHVEHIVAKANRSLGFLKRNLHQCPERVKAQAYLALVRPILEYASAAWDPHSQALVTMLEQTQRRAARFVSNCHSREPGCVTEVVKRLNWQPLQNRRKEKRLKTLHHTVNNTSAIHIPQYFNKQQDRYRTRNYHSNKFSAPITKTDTYKNSFFPRTIVDWNNLPADITESGNHDCFARALDCFFRCGNNV